MNSQENPKDQKPPFFKKWRDMYILVAGILSALIIMFYLLSQNYQ